MSETKQDIGAPPPVWIGHVVLGVSRYRESLAFFESLGMRTIVANPTLAVLELRGGTHIVLRQDADAEPKYIEFDLMVDDLPAQRAALLEAGLEPTTIQKGRIHSSFEVVEPSGHTLKFNDSHVVGVV
ncbi:MAG: VOC family protein [Myxococcota bacterium]